MTYLVIAQSIVITFLVFHTLRNRTQINVLADLTTKCMSLSVLFNNHLFPQQRIDLEDFFEGEDELAG